LIEREKILAVKILMNGYILTSSGVNDEIIEKIKKETKREDINEIEIEKYINKWFREWFIFDIEYNYKIYIDTKIDIKIFKKQFIIYQKIYLDTINNKSLSKIVEKNIQSNNIETLGIQTRKELEIIKNGTVFINYIENNEGEEKLIERFVMRPAIIELEGISKLNIVKEKLLKILLTKINIIVIRMNKIFIPISKIQTSKTIKTNKNIIKMAASA
jgi:hypothetical protein